MNPFTAGRRAASQGFSITRYDKVEKILYGRGPVGGVVSITVNGGSAISANVNAVGVWSKTFPAGIADNAVVIATAPMTDRFVVPESVVITPPVDPPTGGSSPGGGANNVADHSDPNNAYLVAAIAA